MTAFVPRAGDASGPRTESFLSVVIPARNEAASLPQLVREIIQALRPVGECAGAIVPERPGRFEIIIVDDGFDGCRLHWFWNG